MSSDAASGLGDAAAAPHAHSYLGTLEAVDAAHAPLDDSPLSLPLFVVPHSVLFPGGSLPLREHTTRSWQLAALEAVLAAPAATTGLLAVCDRVPLPGEVICLARVQRMRRPGSLVPGDESLVVVATGCARAHVIGVSVSADGAPTVQARPIAEAPAARMPPAACTHAGAIVARAASEASLAARLRAAPALLAIAPSAAALEVLPPTELSFWAASHLPLDIAQRKARSAPQRRIALRSHALTRAYPPASGAAG
jgi:hypothetical protein